MVNHQDDFAAFEHELRHREAEASMRALQVERARASLEAAKYLQDRINPFNPTTAAGRKCKQDMLCALIRFCVENIGEKSNMLDRLMLRGFFDRSWKLGGQEDLGRDS